ncbi:protein of unknown function [Paraburkholderia kururiensis]
MLRDVAAVQMRRRCLQSLAAQAFASIDGALVRTFPNVGVHRARVLRKHQRPWRCM